MEKTSKLNRFIGALMLIIGSAAIVNNIDFIPYFEDYFFEQTWSYGEREEKIINKNGWEIVLWFVGVALVVVGVILLIRGIISVIKNKASGQIFTIILGACGAVFFGYKTGYQTYDFIDHIRGDDWNKWIDDSEKTQYLLRNYLWISEFAVFAVLSILLMVFAIISMNKSKAAGYQNGGYGAYQAPAYEQNPTYMQNPVYNQNPNLTQYADENAYQQKTCKNCGTLFVGKFCIKCGTPWNE